ncbi:MAG: hypothetical protein HY684_01860 [Chloroflexi bacterium]|nr:hypothetical protein [Chloroflexota bacterium]
MGWHVEMAPEAPDIHIVVQDETVTVFESGSRQVSFPLWGLSKVIVGLQKAERWHCRCSPATASSVSPTCPVHTPRGERVKVEKWG